MHGSRDVLHLLRADIGKLHRELVGHLLVDRARHADAADLGEALEARGDVDAVAEQVAVALDHVADGDADAEGHLPARRIGHVAGSQAFLDVDRAAYRFDRARKFSEHGVARRVEDAPACLGDEVIRDGTIRGETPQRLLLVLGHQPGVAGNISRKNCRDLAFHDSQPRTTICSRQNAVYGAPTQPSSSDRRKRRGWISFGFREACRRDPRDAQCIAVVSSSCWMLLK